MFHYSKREINVISLVITSIIFVFIFMPSQNKNSVPINTTINAITNKETTVTQETKEQTTKKQIWQIEIPKIELKATIAEGTDEATMDKYVGHFTETSELIGNVGLAGHNRGYPVNYFAKLKELEKYDVILYRLNENLKIYLVESIGIIKDTDWTYLKQTRDNRITLITCVENKENLRLCIQAKEIKGE